MTKDKFNLLTIESQIEEINALVETEGSLRKACDRLTINRSSIRNRFRNEGYEFCKNCNKYIKANEHNCNINCNTDKINRNKSIKKTTLKHKENTDVLLSEDMKENFLWMMSNFDILQTIINERIQGEYKCNTNVIEVKSSEFIIDLPASSTRHTTIRVNEAVWNEFNEIYNLKYKHLNKADVLSMALKQFNNNNK